jgi:hypothetical protein
MSSCNPNPTCYHALDSRNTTTTELATSVLVFDGSDKTLSMPWQDIINYSHIIMLFGKAFDQSHPWGPVFQFKTDTEYAHHVFRQFAYE